MAVTVEEQAALLAEKEVWVQAVAEQVHQARNIDLETCVTAARWASLWMDDFKSLMEERPPSSQEGVKSFISAAWLSSLERSEGVPRYPSGVPSLKAIIAANEAFCLAFGDEADYARQLLEEIAQGAGT